MVFIDYYSDFNSQHQLIQLDLIIQPLISTLFGNSTVNVVRLPSFADRFPMAFLLVSHVHEVDFRFHFLLIHSIVMRLISFIESKRFDFIEEPLHFL